MVQDVRAARVRANLRREHRRAAEVAEREAEAARAGEELGKRKRPRAGRASVDPRGRPPRRGDDAARALSRAVKPRAPPARRDASSRAGGRASETLEVARGGLPRLPACAWRAPGAGAERGIPVGAYVCAEAATVQRVRAALLDTGRLKPHGVTRFDARAWGVFGARSDHPEDAADATDLARPGAASWAVHVFGLPPGARENDAIAALVAAGETRYLPGLRMGSPARHLERLRGAPARARRRVAPRGRLSLIHI